MKNFFKSLFGRNQDDVESEPAENSYSTSGEGHESQADGGFRPEINRTVMPEADPEPAPVPGDELQTAAPTPDIVLCVPGPWADWQELIASVIAATNGEFIAAAQRIAHVKGKYHMEMEFCSRDEQLAPAFRAAGAGRLGDSELAEIAAHRSVVYLTAPAGPIEQVLLAAECAKALTEAGGFGVKVETAGVAFSPEDWEVLSSDNIGFVAGFLLLVRDGDHAIRSFGLRAFGLPDVYCSSPDDSFDLEELANTFLKYQLFERPVLTSGETFSIGADTPSFRISHIQDTKSAPGSTFFNPYGFIQLEPAAATV